MRQIYAFIWVLGSGPSTRGQCARNHKSQTFQNMVHSNKNLKAISIRAICLTIVESLGGLSAGLGTVKENGVNMFQTTYLFSNSLHNWSHICF